MPHALVYTSRAEPALTETELEVVLVKSRALNSMRGITGALLKRGRDIVQYLEGEPAALDRTFERIAASPLHRDVAIVVRTGEVARVFDRWHMAFHDLQRLHSRSGSTHDWEGALADVQRASAANEPARVLLEQWTALGTRAR